MVKPCPKTLHAFTVGPSSTAIGQLRLLANQRDSASPASILKSLWIFLTASKFPALFTSIFFSLIRVVIKSESMPSFERHSDLTFSGTMIFVSSAIFLNNSIFARRISVEASKTTFMFTIYYIRNRLSRTQSGHRDSAFGCWEEDSVVRLGSGNGITVFSLPPFD